MNDPSQMMNQSLKKNQSQMMSQSSHMLSMSQQPQQQQMLNHQQQQRVNVIPQMVSQSMNQSQMVMNQTQSQMLNRGGGYGMWPPTEQLKFQNPMNFPGFVSSSKPLGRGSWKGKKGIDKRKEGRRIEKSVIGGSSGSIGGAGTVGIGIGGGGGYKPPTLQELQHQNRLKARRYFPKKKFNNRSAPFAPRNTTSFIIRAKKSGGIASLVSPCPVTPAVLPTPIFSPSREALVDTAKEEWGVDGYGSMKGLIRLRSPGNDLDAHEDEEEDEGGSSESDVEEHLEVERRLDHDLSRFEMIYPNYGAEYNNVLENRVDDQDTHIAQT